MATKEQAKEVLEDVLEEFKFKAETSRLFEELVFNSGVFEPCNQKKSDYLWDELKKQGIPYETISDALDRWAGLLLEVK